MKAATAPSPPVPDRRAGALGRLLLLAAALALVPADVVRAEPGDSCQVSSDCDPGERCKAGVCGPRQSSNAGPDETGRRQSGRGGNPAYSEPPFPRGGHACCDAFGNSRCLIANGPLPFGAPCFCYGQGYGAVCR